MSPQDARQLGAFIRRHREDRGLSQAGLGRAVGVQASTIMRLERGTIGAPDPAKLQRLAEALDVDVEELMVLHPTVAQGMPGYGTYFRSRGLSADAAAEAEAFLKELEARDRKATGRRNAKRD